MKLGPLQQKWVDALRSGEYKQARGFLKSKFGYCCLGVACEVLGIEPIYAGNVYSYAGHNACLPDEAVNKLKTFSDYGPAPILSGKSLASMNDSGCSFQEIADYIEKHAELVFKEPA